MSAAPAPASLAGWLEHLEQLHPLGQAGIELGLERVRQVKDLLPQSQHCPVITVGGTNGKGSTCAYLQNILLRAGYKVGCYTSPHLLRYNERVRLNGVPADDAVLCAAFARVEAARQASGVALTYFEFGTLAAWEVFAAAGVEVAILEVGLGGRLDAVNVYEPDVAVITSVALDHTAWLGDDRDSIGYEKAGIFRAGKPALCADPQPPQGLLQQAAALGADLRLLGRDFGFEKAAAGTVENRWQWRWWCRRPDGQVLRRPLAYPGLRGATQLFNASVALAALEALGDRLPVTMQAIRPGLIETELCGRFQVIPGKPSIVLDVGHNPQALAVLADNLGNMGFFNRTHAVLGMLSDKDIANALLPLRGKIDVWHLASLPGPRGTPAATLAEILAGLGVAGEVFCHDSPQQAMQAAREAAAESDRILAFGSFYTVAGALQVLGRTA
ncbi:MAG: bifunctional tetrahydrofolate synthase/dihydrofolate synthase [Azonexus sp.]|nr:bifunctional tetrahydrofolate synthase/dihydrofolate synthase [Azonexus sp.]